MYVLLASKQLIPNLTPDSQNAVTPERKRRFSALVTPLMTFIRNIFSFFRFRLCYMMAVVMNYASGSGFSLRMESFRNWVGIRVPLLEGKPPSHPTPEDSCRRHCFQRFCHYCIPPELIEKTPDSSVTFSSSFPCTAKIAARKHGILSGITKSAQFSAQFNDSR